MFSELSKVWFVEPEVNLPWTKLDFFFLEERGRCEEKKSFYFNKDRLVNDA
jgi:hypothetical protein